MKTIKIILSLGVIGLISGGLFVYSGLFPIGADTPHSPAVHWLLEQTRERSIARASADIKVPSLTDPELLLSGGTDYNDMCSACHLKPGQEQSDMSLGLYPSPPNLTLKHLEHEYNHEDTEGAAKRNFWIIKHGIKASGMPAWGITHDDERIWAMVAFLERLPELTPEQYQIITARD
jgi:mono/diheme cytochrome c family protein